MPDDWNPCTYERRLGGDVFAYPLFEQAQQSIYEEEKHQNKKRSHDWLSRPEEGGESFFSRLDTAVQRESGGEGKRNMNNVYRD